MDSFRSSHSSYGSGHITHYLLALLGTVTVTVIELKVPIFTNGLRTAPFALIPTIAALYGDYWSGIFAIALSSAAVDYTMPPTGIALDKTTLFKVFEFIVLTSVIFALAWRSRRLYDSNVSLRAATEMLQDITDDLKVEAQGNQRELKKLNAVNKRLVALVDKFVADDEYWARKLTTPVPPTKKVIKKAVR